MKRFVLLGIVAVLGLGRAVRADNFFCDTDQNFFDVRQCLVNDPIDTCRTNFPTCNVDDFLVDAQDVVSFMIVQCCIPGNTDTQWDACFLGRMRAVRRARALPAAYRKHIRQSVLSYINDAELECTEH